MDVIKQALNTDSVLDITILQQLGRQSLKEVLLKERSDLSLRQYQVLWARLQRTACKLTVTDKHLTAACNAVCVFLTDASQSFNLELRNFAYSKGTWAEGFEVVRKGFNNGKIKPAQQVLSTLLLLLEQDNDQNSAKLTAQSVVDELVRIVITAQPEMRVKEACTVLLAFLRGLPSHTDLSASCHGLGERICKAFQQRCQQYQINTFRFDTNTKPPVYMFFLGLLLNIHLPESRTATMKLFAFMCSKGLKHDHSSNVVLASEMIQVYLGANQKSLADFSTEIFPAIFSSKGQFHAFLEQYQPSKDNDALTIEIYLVVLEVGRRQGYIPEQELAQNLTQSISDDTNAEELTASDWAGFDVLLSHSNPIYRLRGYNMLTMSHETTREVMCEVLDCLKSNFRSLHDDSDAYYRDVYVSISRRFLTRIIKSAQTAQRQHQKQYSDYTESPIIERYGHFLNSYLTFLVSELGPHISYPRHILALQVLHQILDSELLSTKIPDKLKTGSALTRPLISLVSDPFEDVRAISTTILTLLSRQDHMAIVEEFEKAKLLVQAEQLSAGTNRSDHADALGRLYSIDCAVSARSKSYDHKASPPKHNGTTVANIVFTLAHYLVTIDQLQPISSFPLHGTLLGLAYCLEPSMQIAPSISSLGFEILKICKRVWNLVQTELCIDSPERATENDDQDELTGPKDLLAYSWRALRDSSLLLQALLKASSICDTTLSKAIGDLCWVQLCQLRHRGAFSTVTQTFVLCCQVVRSYKEDSLQLEMSRWRMSALQEIDNQSAQLTRRSAGLPAMFTALLDPSDPSDFISAMDDLNKIAAEQVPEGVDPDETNVRLPQVHALNCIKDIMLNSRFRVVTEPLVVAMLNLAAQSLGSRQWAIRNCGLMLFRACINRLTPEATAIFHSSTDAAWHYVDSSPLALATKLLDGVDNADEPTQPEIVFAALDLLGQIPIQVGTETSINKLLENQLDHPLWAVREHAARLRASTILLGQQNSAFSMIMHLLKMASVKESANALHGRLLCARLILKNSWTHAKAESGYMVLQSISFLNSMTRKILESGCDAFVLATILDILNEAYSGGLERGLDCTKVENCSNLIMSAYATHSDEWSNFLLHRAIQLNTVLKQLWKMSSMYETNGVDQSHPGSHDRFQVIEIVDDDIALYVLNELAKISARSLPADSSDLYIAFITKKYHEGVVAAATQLLFKTLQASAKTLTAAQAESLTSILTSSNLGTRELFNSRVVLTAILVPHIIRTAWDRPSELVAQFVSLLQQSLLDYIEMPTRLNALTAIGAIQSYLLRGGICGLAFSESDRLRVLLMLYDCLNDDDEDIRELATSLVCSIVSPGHRHDLVRLASPVQTRHMLLRLLFNDFGDNILLTVRGCAKLIGAPVLPAADEIFNLSNYCKTHTVTELIDDTIKSATELFAEEKQNLYIDQIAEIEHWVPKVNISRLEAMSIGERNANSIVQDMFQWVTDGVQALIRILDPDLRTKTIFDPMGPTYNEDILIIFVRILVTARVLLHHQRVTTNKGVEKTTIFDSEGCGDVDIVVGTLQTLRSLCQQQNAHQLVVDNIDAALATS